MLHRPASALVLSALLVALTGCGDDSPSAPPPDAGMDFGPPDLGIDAGPPPPPDVCDELGLARTPFRTTGAGLGMGDVAGDFTAETLAGTYTLSERWSGCESYVFFVHMPRISDDVIRTPVDRLLSEGRRNVQYFFLSTSTDADARRALMEELSAGLDETFAFQGTTVEEQAFWRERFHFVTDEAGAVSGSVGAYVTDYLTFARTPAATVDLGDRGRAGMPPPTVFGIDRAQTWDPGDSLSPAVGAPADLLGMAAFLSHFYEYRGALDARLAAETDTTVVTLLDETTTGRVFVREATLPDAATMAGFDTLELDIEITCNQRNPFGCSEWDRIADIQLCADGAACTDRREIARWITPYWRRGRQRYLIEASPFLGALRDGGTKHFFVELGPEWERATEWDAKVALRMRNRGGEPRATGAIRAFTGGGFGATYNDREPITFTPPADATRVELVTIVTGHGQESSNGCAEWCDHRHAFSVNGSALPILRHEGESIGSDRGCAARADEGVIPGQWGNWAQARAYWCPGMAVQPIRTDITALVTPGSANTIDYEGAFRTGAPAGGDIALSAWVVWYRNP
jgi:hypothetical protein